MSADQPKNQEDRDVHSPNTRRNASRWYARWTQRFRWKTNHPSKLESASQATHSQSTDSEETPVTAEQLREILPTTLHSSRFGDVPVRLVEPRILRRVIRSLTGAVSPWSRTPHNRVIVIDQLTLTTQMIPAEVGLTGVGWHGVPKIPHRMILLVQPERDRRRKESPCQTLLAYWRWLFHAKLHLAIEESLLSNEWFSEQLQRLGPTVLEEAAVVLDEENELLFPRQKESILQELLIVGTELLEFDPALFSVYFPSLNLEDDFRSISRTVFGDREQLEQRLVESRPATPLFATYTTPPQPTFTEESGPKEGLWDRLEDAFEPTTVAKNTLSPRRLEAAMVIWKRLMAKSQNASHVRNHVRSAILCARAQRLAVSRQKRLESQEAVRTEIGHLVERLRDALSLGIEREGEIWRDSLAVLVREATRGFWSPEVRVLYNLQNVCIDAENPFETVSVLRYLCSFGKKPIRKKLPQMRFVSMVKHLNVVERQLSLVRIPRSARLLLTRRVHESLEEMGERIRTLFRPILSESLLRCGIVPQNHCEQAAWDKIVEESLDRIVERGFLSFGDVRDAISRSQMKLPDLHGSELWSGDPLLKTDMMLRSAMEGVYRPGDFWLRWMQKLVSVAFGNRVGRGFMKFVGLPFGGAAISLSFLDYLASKVTHYYTEEPLQTEESSKETAASVETASTEIQPLTEYAVPFTESISEHTVTSASLSESHVVAVTNPANSAKPTSFIESAPPADLTNSTETDLTTESDSRLADRSAETVSPDHASLETLTNTQTEPKEQATVVEQTVAAEQTVATTPVTPPMVTESSAIFLTGPAVLLLGCFLVGLVNFPQFRHGLTQGIYGLFRRLRKILVDHPLDWLTTSTGQPKKFPIIGGLFRSVIFPGLITWLCWPLWIYYDKNQTLPGVVFFLATTILLNSRLWRMLEEVVFDRLGKIWRLYGIRFAVILFSWIAEIFRTGMDAIERFLYMTDEWLRFHQSDSRLSLVIRTVFGTLWSGFSYFIRFAVSLFIEPQINPLKHFPVVTVSHKFLLPTIPFFGSMLTPVIGSHAEALMIATVIITSIPGVFGFLVWELKEGWRLYASNRRPTLGVVMVGSHGETTPRFLKRGFHSGTIPRAFRRLRDAERTARWTGSRQTIRRTQQTLNHTELAVRRCFEREWLRLLELYHLKNVDRFEVFEQSGQLEQSGRLGQSEKNGEEKPTYVPMLRTGKIRLTPTRITVEILAREPDALRSDALKTTNATKLAESVAVQTTVQTVEPVFYPLLTLWLEERNGFLLSDMVWTSEMAAASEVTAASDVAQSTRSEALRAYWRDDILCSFYGLYKMFGVDLVSRQIHQALDTDEHWQVEEKHLAVYRPDGNARIYRLDAPEEAILPESTTSPGVFVRGAALRRSELIYTETAIPWTLWCACWEADTLETARKRLRESFDFEPC